MPCSHAACLCCVSGSLPSPARAARAASSIGTILSDWISLSVSRPLRLLAEDERKDPARSKLHEQPRYPLTESAFCVPSGSCCSATSAPYSAIRSSSSRNCHLGSGCSSRLPLPGNWSTTLTTFLDAYDYDAVPTCKSTYPQIVCVLCQQLPFYPHHSCGKHHILATGSQPTIRPSQSTPGGIYLLPCLNRRGWGWMNLQPPCTQDYYIFRTSATIGAFYAVHPSAQSQSYRRSILEAATAAPPEASSEACNANESSSCCKETHIS